MILFILAGGQMTDNTVEDKDSRETPSIDIYKAWCKACGICAAFCPTGVLARDEAGYPYVKDIDKCIHCGWCEIRCPDFAIHVEGTRKKGEKKTGGEGDEEKAHGEATPG
jgi:2-oxoglutarate ferredoxin oxidoreductase subunit delta